MNSFIYLVMFIITLAAMELNTKIADCEVYPNRISSELQIDPYNARVRTELALSPDQTELAIATLSELRFYNAQTLELVDQITLEHDFSEIHLAWSPNGSEIVVGGSSYNLQTSEFEGNITVFDTNTRRPVWRQELLVDSLSWLPASEFLAVVHDARKLTIFNTQTWEVIQEFDIYQLFGMLPSFLAWSYDGDLLAISSQFAVGDGLLFWRNNEISAVEHLDTGIMGLVMWSPVENRLAILNLDNARISILDTTLNRLVSHFQIDFGNPYTAAWSSDGSLLAIGSNEGLLVWDVFSEMPIETALSLRDMPSFIRIVWAEDKNLMFSTDFVGNVYAWDVFNNPCPIGVIESEVLREGENP